MSKRSSFGENNHRAKLTRGQVQDIRERYAEGNTSFPKLGREYGVHHTTIMRIVHRHLWP